MALREFPFRRPVTQSATAGDFSDWTLQRTLACRAGTWQRTRMLTKGKSLAVGKPCPWSDQQILDLGTVPNYDLAPDGKRFVVFSNLSAASEEKRDVHMAFLLNFLDELRRRVG